MSGEQSQGGTTGTGTTAKGSCVGLAFFVKRQLEQLHSSGYLHQGTGELLPL